MQAPQYQSELLLSVKPMEAPATAYSLYVSQDSVEKAKLLRMLFSNCSVDAVSVTPTYRKPFDMIVKRAHLEEWSGRRDSNPRPSGPKPDALPGCATPRLKTVYLIMASRYRARGLIGTSIPKIPANRCTEIHATSSAGTTIRAIRKKHSPARKNQLCRVCLRGSYMLPVSSA